MANVKLQFKCQQDDECYLTVENRVGWINVSIFENDTVNLIYLDVSTAIKLHKTLRAEINKAKEVSNG